MKMNKYQKQLSISVPMALISFLVMYFTYPAVVIGVVFMLPLAAGIMWTLISMTILISESSFGKWLSEDDK